MVDCLYSRTDEEIEAASPNRAEGISPQKEKRLSRCCHRLIDAVATRRYAFPAYLTATAHYLVTRFYSQRSYVTNDFFCVSAAALSLAGKFENRPRSVDYLIAAMFEVRYAQDAAAVMQFKNSGAYRSQVKECVLHAEELLLEVVGHAFHIDQPYCHVFDLIQVMHYPTEDRRVKLLVRRFWQMTNDSCKTTLWLQFSARKLAVAIFLLAARYSGLTPDLEKLWKYYYHDNGPGGGPSDHRHEIKHIWRQLLVEYDARSRIHEHASSCDL